MSIPGSGSPLLLATTAAAADAYVIPKSLRFNSDDTASLRRTPSSAGNRKTWTWSCWAKRGKISNENQPFLTVNNGSQSFIMGWHGYYSDGRRDGIEINNVAGSGDGYITTAVFRDPSAWYHIVVAFDSTLSTASDRIKIWVNGEAQTFQATSNGPSQNQEWLVNSATAHTIGDSVTSYAWLGQLDSLLADVQLVDGQALAPTDLAETRSSDGVWVPKEYEGGYGPLVDQNQTWSSNTFFNNNGNGYNGSNTITKLFDGVASSVGDDGVLPAGSGDFTLTFSQFSSASTVTIDLEGGGNALKINGSFVTLPGGSRTTVTYNVSGLTSIQWYHGAGSTYCFLLSIKVDGKELVDSGVTVPNNSFHLNFSDSSTNQALGFDSAPTIPDPDPKKGMDVVTWTGNSTGQRRIGGLNFEPGLIWIKRRNASYGGILVDSVRGLNSSGHAGVLYTNATSAEDTGNTQSVRSFNFDGFNLGTDGGVNLNSSTYVGWAWRAGGTAVDNTDGSVTSQVSVSNDYGFSIVKYTMGGSDITVGHGLSTEPKWIITRRFDNTDSYIVYHASLGKDKYLFLNGSQTAFTDTADAFTSTSSSVFDARAGLINAGECIAYCWSEISGFSKFSSYTGNAGAISVTGLGFKPRFLLIRPTATGSWMMFDSERGTSVRLKAQTTDAEASASISLTFDSDGFSLNTTDGDFNGSGVTYLYMAFADRPGNNWDVNNIVTNAGLTTSKTQFDVVTYTGNGGTLAVGQPVYSDETTGGNNTSNMFDGSGSSWNNLTAGNTITFTPSRAIACTQLDIWVDTDTPLRVNVNGGGYGSTFTQSGLGYVNITPGGGMTSLTSLLIDAPSGGGGSGAGIRGLRINGTTIVVDGDGGPGLKFKPDFVWYKHRSGASSHGLFDSVRGATKYMNSNGTGAEQTVSGVTSFDDNGFTLGSDSGGNGSGTWVAWCWNAGANSNKTYTVKVVSDSGNKYRFDNFGTSAVTLDLQEGSTYIFDQSDSSNAGHPIRFGTSANGTDYTTGVTHTGTPGSAGAKTTLVLGTGVATLYYSCANHSGMGGQINTNSTAGASNFDGSVQSAVKANQTAGFSIVSATAPSSSTSFTLGHGLNATPSFIIFRQRTASNWAVYHSGIASAETKYLHLNSANAVGTATTWNNTAPTSNVFSSTMSGNWDLGADLIAYCFANVPGYQRIGSYTGSGSSGNKIVTGFKPRFLLIKRTSTTGYWNIVDSERGGGEALHPNLSNSSSTGGPWITFSNDGFTLTTTGDGYNDSGATFIYLAIGDDEIGSGEDCLVDVPNEVTADADATDTEGGYQRGNYATLNPLQSGATLANGNLDATSGQNKAVFATVAVGETGKKFYWEATINDSHFQQIGIADIAVGKTGAAPGDSGSEGYIYLANGEIYHDGATTSTGNPTFTTGDIIGVKYDDTTRSLSWNKNGGNFFGAVTVDDGRHYAPVFGAGGGSDEISVSVNFGQMRFKYGLPSGYAALNTTALPAATIADGSTAFDTRLYTGNSGTLAFSDLEMSPDLVWIKQRSHNGANMLFDAVRGATKRLVSNQDLTEGTVQGVTSFDSNGFTLGNDADCNYSGRTHVAWAWDAGTSTVSNTDGSLTASVRANASAGFSIISNNTGSSSGNQSIGHGLNAKPGLVIVKRRDVAENWFVWHSALSSEAGHYLKLNSTASETSQSVWGAGMTSSVIGITANAIGGDNIIYAFAPVAGHSAMGSYEGLGTAGGAFVYLGFRPALLIVKDIDGTWDWYLYDAARNTYNIVNNVLRPSQNYVEEGHATNNTFDFLSNGFKVRGTTSQSEPTNYSGHTYIYYAVAENPFSANGGLAR